MFKCTGEKESDDMGKVMLLVLQIVALSAMLSAFVLLMRAMWQRRPEAPSVSETHLKYWFVPIWKQRGWYTGTGYRCVILAGILFFGSFLLQLIVLFGGLSPR
jgi:hypothetical protein